jgi:4-carboxymuconolactone decarboxylase
LTQSNAQLDRRARSLVTLGILIEQRLATRSAITSVSAMAKVTRQEIEEAITHAAAYAAFPAACAAMEAAVRIFDEIESGGSNAIPSGQTF